MSKDREWKRFPTDEMSLRGLIEACTSNEETGEPHSPHTVIISLAEEILRLQATLDVVTDRALMADLERADDEPDPTPESGWNEATGG